MIKSLLRSSYLYLYLIIIATALFGCASHPVKTPEQLYADASMHTHGIKSNSKSYGHALVHYKKAKKNINSLLHKYPSSLLVTDFKYNQKKMAGLRFKQFQALEGELETLATAEQSPLACALLITQTVENVQYLSLTGMVSRFNKANERAEAIQLLKRMYGKMIKIPKEEGADLRLTGLVDIARVYSELGDVSQAEKILTESRAEARLMKSTIWRWLILKDIAIGFGNTQNFTQAIKTVNLLHKQHDKDVSLSKITDKLMKAGRLKHAVDIIPMIKSPSLQVRIYLEVAKEYARKGDQNRAERLRATALKSSALIDASKTPKQKSDAWVHVARMYSETGQDEKQDKLLKQALKIARSMTNQEQRSYALYQISEQYTETGQMKKAFAVIDLMSGPLGTDFPNGAIAEVYAETGYFNKALEMTKRIHGDIERDSWLLRIVEHLVKANKLGVALQVSNSIKDEQYSRGKAYQLIVDAHVKQRNLTQALEIAKKIKGKEIKAESLVTIALSTANSFRMGQKSRKILAGIVQEVAPLKLKLSWNES